MRFLISAFLLSSAVAAGAQSLPYQNPALPPAQRAADLVSRMTLEEKAAQSINTAPAIPRLGVPVYDYWSEGLHGVARSGYATLFPQAVGMAATFDAPLLHDEGVEASPASAGRDIGGVGCPQRVRDLARPRRTPFTTTPARLRPARRRRQV